MLPHLSVRRILYYLRTYYVLTYSAGAATLNETWPPILEFAIFLGHLLTYIMNFNLKAVLCKGKLYFSVLFMASSAAVTPQHLSHVDMLMCAAAPLPLADVEKLFTKAEVSIQL